MPPKTNVPRQGLTTPGGQKRGISRRGLLPPDRLINTVPDGGILTP